jgi:hypothetical protein
MEDEKKQVLESLFVTYEQGLALKELGFDGDCFAFHSTIYGLVIGGASGNSVLYESAGECLAPLKQQVFQWFRDKHNFDGWATPCYTSDGKFYSFIIENGEESEIDGSYDDFKTYEEAESACIDKLIITVKSEL